MKNEKIVYETVDTLTVFLDKQNVLFKKIKEDGNECSKKSAVINGILKKLYQYFDQADYSKFRKYIKNIYLEIYLTSYGEFYSEKIDMDTEFATKFDEFCNLTKKYLIKE